jgi:hypothetical protein
MPDNSTRDRIRALVRDVLDKSIPPAPESERPESNPEPTSAGTSSRVIDTGPKKSGTSSVATTVRDESAKTFIT